MKIIRHRRTVRGLSPAACIGQFVVSGTAASLLALSALPANAQDAAKPAAVPVTAQKAVPPAAAMTKDWPELRGDTTRRGVSEDKIVPPLSLLWRFSAGAVPNASSPAIVGDTVYYAARARNGANGTVFAVDTQTGSQKWRYPNDDNGLPERATFLTSPLVNEGRVYIGSSNGYMYVIDAKSGKLIVRYRTARPINSSPTIIAGVLYFGSNDGTFYALDAKTGNYVWNQPYTVRDGINSAPIVADGMVFFTTNDNSVHAVRQATGIGRWTVRMPSGILDDSAVFADSTLYVPSGRNMVALQPTSGITRWSRTMPDDIVAPPIADQGVVFTIIRNTSTNGSTIYAIRSGNGRDFWDKPAEIALAPAAAPTLVGNVIYIPTNQNKLIAVSRENGKVLWEYYIDPSSNLPRREDFDAQGGVGGGGNGIGGDGGGRERRWRFPRCRWLPRRRGRTRRSRWVSRGWRRIPRRRGRLSRRGWWSWWRGRLSGRRGWSRWTRWRGWFSRGWRRWLSGRGRRAVWWAQQSHPQCECRLADSPGRGRRWRDLCCRGRRLAFVLPA